MKRTVLFFISIFAIFIVNAQETRTPVLDLYDYSINGGRVVNYGGSGDIEIIIQNTGDTNITGTFATMTTDDSYVNSLTNAENVNLGSIGANGGVAVISNKFHIEVADSIPDQHSIHLILTLTGTDKYSWTKHLYLTANAPSLSVSDFTVANDDNSNLRLDAGETADLNFTVSNTGHAEISANLLAEIVGGTSPYLVINTNTFPLDVLEVGETINASINVTADINTPLESEVLIKLNVNAEDYSISPNKSIIIGLIETILMGNDSRVVCSARFYDSGGATGNYSSGEDYVMTFLPAGSSTIVAEFQSFLTENNYDKLTIYDGINESAPEIGTYTGTNSPGTIEGENGLTFKFHSDGMIQKSGWYADISCYSTDAPPICANTPNPATGSLNIAPTSLQWEAVNNTDSYDVYFGTSENPLDNTPINTTSTSLNITVEAATIYYWTVIAKNSHGESSNCEIWTFTTRGDEFIMQNTTVTTCNGVFFDSGGENGSYSPNENYTMTFLPGESNSVITAEFYGNFSVEGCSFDNLKVYDGEDNNATLLAEFCGSNKPSEILKATNTSGALTFVFHSDGSTNKSGWQADIKCESSSSNISLNENKEIEIYPNPTNGNFVIKTNFNENNNNKIQIYTISGKLVFERYVISNEENINLSNQAKGIYFVRIISEKEIYNKKIIIE